jgi:NAD(P)-dependent dehydrogenase (short-subunit alcohol dehydrogenase family)
MKNIIVTGTSRGIGFELALNLLMQVKYWLFQENTKRLLA